MTSIINELQSKQFSGSGKAQFLALKDDINEAFNNGWSRKDIWQHLRDEKKTTLSYPQFCHYIRVQKELSTTNKNDEKKVLGKFYAPKTPLSDEELF